MVHSNQKILPLFNSIGIFIIAYLALYFSIDLRLAYHVQQPLFNMGWKALEVSLHTPGGFIGHIGNLITEMYYYPVIGALCSTAITLTTAFLFKRTLLTRANTLFTYVFTSIVGLFTLILFTDYMFEVKYLLILIFSLALVNLYRSILNRINNILLLNFILLAISIIAFILSGGLALLIFSILTVVLLLPKATEKRNVVLLFLSLLYAVSIPLFSQGVYQIIPIQKLYLSGINVDTFGNKGYLFLLGALILIHVVSIVTSKLPVIQNVWVLRVSYLVFFAAFWFLPSSLVNDTNKQKIEIDYWAYNSEWDKIIDSYRNQHINDQLSAFQLNRAIYHKGNFLKNFFSVPQRYGFNALLLEQHVNKKMLIATSDIYYDLGFINESRHWIHESFSVYGFQPRILRRMVEVNIINGNYNAAKKYIIHLKKSIVNRKWALEQEQFLHNESLVQSNTIYHTKRQGLPANDFLANRNAPWFNLVNLNTESKISKMGFDYLIATYLTKHQLHRIVDIVPEFRKHDYKELPAAVQEAIFLHTFNTGNSKIELAGYDLSKEVYSGIKEYTELYMAYKKNDMSAGKKLKEKYAHTYCYYMHFVSPITLQKENKR